MAVPVYLAGGESSSYPCPYAHRGCKFKITAYDNFGHIPECPANDASVDLDAHFKKVAAQQQENSEKFRTANELAKKRRDHYEQPYRLVAEFDPVTGRPISSPNQNLALKTPTAQSPTALRKNNLVPVLIGLSVIFLAWLFWGGR